MLVLSLLCFLTLCLLLAAGWKLLNIATPGAVSSQIQPDLESARADGGFYRPMERLLAEQDFQFLASRPGVTPQVLRRMRADRRRIFRQYLHSLSADFAFVAGRLRAIMVESPNSREDLAGSLLKARILFAAAILAIETRLLLHACGLHRIRISAQFLTEGLANLQLELRHFTDAPGLTAFKAV